MKLLTRPEFKRQVFERDGHTCVFCSLPAVDAHHIMDRKLWVDGGYYLDNGASVCEDHHFRCETTEISVEEVREACGITHALLPDKYDQTLRYDKWGNEILEDGTRRGGPLFRIGGTQKILNIGGKLRLFVHEYE